MDSIESLQWVRQAGLEEISKKYVDKLKKVFVPCLNIKDEKILVIGDVGYKDRSISPMLATSYYLAASELNLNSKLVLQEVKSRGSVADCDVITSLENLEQGSVVVMCQSDKLGSIGSLGKSLRKYCVKRKFRFFSAMSLGDLSNDKMAEVVSAIDVEYKPMQLRLSSVKKTLDAASKIEVRTDQGTDLTIDVEGVSAISADGNYSSQGTGGNMPAGEVYLPPKGKGVNGKLVVDGSSRNHKHTTIIEEPIEIDIKDGSIINIKGGKEAELLQDTLKWAASVSKKPGSIRRIGEFGIGMNPNAKIIGSTLVDEKSLGTAHIGIGSNYWFGGTIFSIIHLDQIFKNPEIIVDREKLVF